MLRLSAQAFSLHPVLQQPARLLQRILRGDLANVDFGDLVGHVIALGFQEVSGRGSHRLFSRPGVRELVNLQEQTGQGKLYQIRQVATLVRRYDLELEDER